ncbi:hypothetical protein [Waltera sp.]|uniref:hypothetical protein n=1 Tax=Waltera sp. TaxID=2815806 RepID=UPI003AB993EB
MKAKKLNERPKAFIGALISVGASVAGNLIGKSQQKKAQKQQEEIAQKQAEFSAAQQQAPILSEVLNNNRKNFRTIGDELIMRNGGNIPRKGVVPLVAEGGTAIPIKKDSFLLKGRKHNTGGIVIGKGKNSIEAEGDEVVQITPKQLRVFSAQPILNGNSPAELVQKGAKPSKVFDAQERFKDRNNLNDDGTKKKRNMRTITGKKKLGGLSRKKDYGSDKKPYPSVKSKDFAGGGRSYPIPTKADARDALRLAGLHGRSDVKAKVYKKYPELKNKKATLGTFGSLTGANRRLLALNQNVPSAGITAGAKIINPSASSIKPMNLSSNNGSKGFNLFKGIDKGEAISSGIGAFGTLISGLLNKGSIDKTSAPQVPAPQLVTPAKLKTNININPELSENRENELRINRLIRGNTGSSAAALARIQSNSYRSLSERNKLRSHKENVETQLYNQDSMNRQQVGAANAQQVNETNRFNSLSTIQTANDKVQATANNRTQMIEGVTSAVRDYQLGVDKKRSEENATAAMISANPEQMELFLKLMEKNKGRLGNVRSTLFRCGGKKKIA